MSSHSNHPGSTVESRPITVVGAFWCFIATTVIGLVSAALIVLDKKPFEDAAHDANLAQGVDTDRVADASTIVVAVLSVIIALLFVLFAVKLRAGRNWARIVLTVVTALDVVSILVNGGSVLGYVGLVFAVLGVALSFAPASNAYFTSTKAAR
ncbi:hypothetical protein [Amycolatopsis sp. NPDC051061]|uniref:hypothetical protein n=1 Tax=Amycolatopsis sp. NPDC051061 TaxID=3155042 RepID=UPI003433B361